MDVDQKEHILGMAGHGQMDIGDIFRTIFNSCDRENTDSVCVAELIEFIKPFLVQDLNALEDLRLSLDPTGTSAFVNSQTFYRVMNDWCQKVATSSSNGSTDFDNTPSLTNVIEDKDLPYTHSTPRASLGDKLLRCKDLLNLSNVSGYSLSTSRVENGGESDKTMLEEEVKKLEHQLSKTTNELLMIRQQLAISEDQNDQLQQDLRRTTRRLHAEQQTNENLQKDIKCSEDLRDELAACKKQMEELKKKLSQSEKDSLYHKDLIDEMEQERTQLEKKIETLNDQQQKCLNDLFDINTEFDAKERALSEITAAYKELKTKFCEQKDFVDQLREENNSLGYQKSRLEKLLKAKASDSTHSNLDDKEQQESSEEDISWKMQQGDEKQENPDANNKRESLYTEMSKASPQKLNSTEYHTFLFEKEELIAELEDQVEKLTSQIAEIQEQNKKLIQSKEEKKLSEELLENQIDNLKRRLVHFERHAVIAEQEHESSQCEQLQEKVKILEKALKDVDDEKLQTLSELENIIAENLTLKANLEALQTELQKSRQELTDAKEQLDVALRESKELKEELQKLGEYKEDKAKLENELKEFKDNLEKKLVAEFEAKVKYSMDAEENIILLTQKRNKQDEELANIRTEFVCTAKALAHAENQLTELTTEKSSLKKEIDCLNVSKTDLEVELSQVEMERNQSLASRTNIDSVAAAVHKHIQDKNTIIEKLKVASQTLKASLDTAQGDLMHKIVDISELRNKLITDMGIKNELWKRVKDLEHNLNKNISEMSQLKEDYRSLLGSNKELKLEYNNLLIVYDMEVIKNGKLVKQFTKCREESNSVQAELNNIIAQTTQKDQRLTELILEYENRTNEVVDKQDFSGQTTDVDIEEVIGDIKTEGDQILEELEVRLNEELDKNMDLTRDVFRLKENCAKNNEELEQMKKRLADNEAEMAKKLKTSCENYAGLAGERNRIIDSAKLKDIQLVDIQRELDRIKETLAEETKKTSTLSEELAVKNETIEKYNLLTEELERVNETISKRDIEINRLSRELMVAENTLKEVTEVKIALNRQLKDVEQKWNFDRDKLQKQVVKLNKKLKEKQIEIENISDNNKSVKDELNVLQQENNKLKQKLNSSTNEKRKLENQISETNAKYVALISQVTEIENINKKLQAEKDEFASVTKQEKEALNRELMSSNALSEKTNRRLQEELRKNAALFEKYTELKKERDKLIFDLKENQALLENGQASYNKKQSDLEDLEMRHRTLQAEKNNLEYLLEESRNEIDQMASELSRLQKPNRDGRTYSRQQITIDKLKDKVENLEGELRAEKSKNQQLQNGSLLMEEKVFGCKKEGLEMVQKQLSEKEGHLQALQVRNGEVACEVANLENRLEKVRNKVKDLNRKLKGKPVNEIGIQVEFSEEENGDKCEGKTINKFTLSSRGESPDSACQDTETNIGLGNLKNHAFFGSWNHSDSVLEVPSLDDVNWFADDDIEELGLGDCSPRTILVREELENKVTALTLRLVANASSISERVDKQTEKFRCQYEAILKLLRDISYRLRDHVCIGTSEPIMPVHVLLEEIKLQLRILVQSASQVGVLICEGRMKPCWNLLLNYMAILRQDNQAVYRSSRETTPTQTGFVRRSTRSTQDVKGKVPHRRSCFGRCARLSGLLMIVAVFALAVSLAINLNCRMSASEAQYCPLDSLVRRINNGFPPM